jgi:hypothetical protein
MTVVLNEEGLNFLLRSEIGPVGRHIERIARGVRDRAESEAHAGHPARPNERSGILFQSINFPGLVRDEESGSVQGQVGTGATSPRQAFNYPLALELGVPAAFPPSHLQPTQSYHYPFLRPALEAEFSQVG